MNHAIDFRFVSRTELSQTVLSQALEMNSRGHGSNMHSHHCQLWCQGFTHISYCDNASDCIFAGLVHSDSTLIHSEEPQPLLYSCSRHS